MRYQLLQIINGVENIIYESDKAYEIKRRYDIDGMQRIRINGKTLLIFQAWDWVNGRPIREYKTRKAPEKLLTTARKKVNLVDANGKIIARYDSVTTAAVENGYCRFHDITNACNRNCMTRAGQFFQWG